LSIEDYNLDKEVFDLLRNKAKWILISGSPWSGKTTFAQALIDVYHQDHNIIKTIESPRDLLVDDDIVQYSFTYWSHDEVRDILLLSRPDYTVYDEVRNKSDFELYKDLRLTWIWLVWVIHATRPVDSIQRFLWTIEMWVIPQVIDTVIYIEKWNIKEIYQLQLTVKVPEWMESEDLARPVIIITSFISKKVEYEVYTFWEQIVVMPINDENFQNTKDAKAKKNVIWEYAKDNIKQRLKQLLPCDFFIKVKWSSIDLYIPEELKWRIIWKWWMAITSLEKTIWLKVNVKTFDELPLLDVKVNMNNAKKSWHFEISLPEELANKNICLLIWTEIVYFNSDPIWVITIQDRAMVKTIQKRWFVIVDTENI
jgi:ATPase